MKIPRSYLGKTCVVVWRDPCTAHLASRRPGREDVPAGLAALATWHEYGVVDNLDDGVVRIVHSVGVNASSIDPSDASESMQVSWVPEALVESIRVLVPETEKPA